MGSRAAREPHTAEERLRFRRADRDANGKLDFNEVETMLEARFPGINSRDVHAIFKGADRNNDGHLDFEEVVDYTRSSAPASRKLREKMQMALASPGLQQSYRESEERVQFRKADLNLDGALSVAEVESLMRHSFPDVKKRSVQDIFQAADRNRDGQIDFQELIDFTRSRNPSNHRLRDKVLTALAAPRSTDRRSTCVAQRRASKPSSQALRRVSSASAVGSPLLVAKLHHDSECMSFFPFFGTLPWRRPVKMTVACRFCSIPWPLKECDVLMHPTWVQNQANRSHGCTNQSGAK